MLLLLAAAIRAPTAWAPRCGTAAGAWCNSKSCRGRPMPRQPTIRGREWPKVYKLDYGQEEAKARFGADPRTYLTDGQKFVGDAEGRSQESARCIDVEWRRDEKGAFTPKRVPGTDQVLAGHLVLLAMGFLGPEADSADATRRRTGSRADECQRPNTDSYATNVPASSPPAIAGAARAWSSGRSMKDAARRASATAI